MKKYYPSIQMLRGVLFLFILAFHCGAPFASFGWGGVEAFFVISSFFLVRKYWGNGSLNVKDQFIHRITRLYPPYVAVLLLAAMYALLMKAIPYDLITHLLSAQNFQWMVTGYKSAMQPMTAHTWTLSIEVWGGLVWLLLLKGLSKDQFRKSMYAMLVVGIAYRVVTVIIGADVWIVSLCPLAHFDAFACGSLLAISIKENKAEKKVGILSIIGVVGIMACIGYIGNANGINLIDAYGLLSSSKNYLNNWFTANIYLFISLFTTGLVGLLYLQDERRTGEVSLIGRAFVKLGDNSYILYLFHWPILVVLRRFSSNWVLQYVAVFIASVIAAMAFNWFYSKMQKKLSGGK